jgi:hypothetical protein
MEKLATVIALKVRDTVAGVIGASHVSGDNEKWKSFSERLTDSGQPIKVVLWLEEPLGQGGRHRLQARATTMARLLKGKLRWLTRQILVVNTHIGSPPSGVNVTFVN